MGNDLETGSDLLINWIRPRVIDLDMIFHIHIHIQTYTNHLFFTQNLPKTSNPLNIPNLSIYFYQLKTEVQIR